MRTVPSSTYLRSALVALGAVLCLAAPASAAQFTSIQPGLNHTCAIKADATAWCWGEGRMGAVGVIGAVRPRTPIKVIGSYQTVQISSGQEFWCQTLADRTASCSGAAERGQIGNGSLRPAQYPMEVTGLVAVQQVKVGKATACAIEGTAVACWGDGGRGQLGNGKLAEGPQATPVAVPNLSGIVDLAVGESHVCAVRSDGLVFCWGDTADGKLGNGIASAITIPGVPVTGLTNARAVAIGDRHSCALRRGGSVWCWGEGKFGQLGVGASTASQTATAVPGLGGVVQIAAAGSTTCAVKNDGTVFCWGDGSNGQIGNGARTSALSPTKVATLTDAVQVGVGNASVCAVTKTQAPFCWGSNRSGQLGTGAPVSVTSLTPQLVNDFVLGPATYLPAEVTGVPTGSTAGGLIEFRDLLLPRRGAKCPSTATLRITARGRASTRTVRPKRTSTGCRLTGRFTLPKNSQRATKATYRITGSGLKPQSRSLKARMT